MEEREEEVEDDIVFKQVLKDKDRIILGTCTTFLFRLPQKQGTKKYAHIKGEKINWEYCQMEKFEIQENKER